MAVQHTHRFQVNSCSTDIDSGVVFWAQSGGARLGYGAARYHWTLATIAEMDAALAAADGNPLEIVLEIDIGAYPNGRAKGWIKGEDTPRFDPGAISTQ